MNNTYISKRHKIIKLINSIAQNIYLNMYLIMLILPSVAYSINSDQWLVQKIQVEDGLPDSTVFSMQQDSSGFIWFGTVNGLARYDGYNFKIYKHDGADTNTITNNNAGNIFIDTSNVLWIGTFGGGFNAIDLNTGKLTRYPYSNIQKEMTVSEFVQTFHQDQQSNMWIGTPKGLYQFNNHVLAHYSHVEGDESSLVHSRVWDIEEDKNGNIWVGTSNGLSQLNPITGKINNFDLPEKMVIDISSNQFRKLFINKNILWIGSSTGLYAFDLVSKQFTSYAIDKNFKINDIYLYENILLIATMKGLLQFDLNKNAFVLENNTLWRSLQSNDIRDILIDQSGLLWLSTRDSGVIKINQIGGLFQQQDIVEDAEASQKIWTTAFDSQGQLYLGTSDTLYRRYAENKFNRIVIENHDQIPGIIRTLKPAKNKGLWIGSSEGLYYLDENLTVAEEITSPFDLVGIKPTNVFSIEETSSGELWLSLYNLGILRWNPKESKAQLIQKYEGGPLTDLNISKVYQDSKDNIWISTYIMGLLRFDIKTEKFILFSNDFADDASLSSNRVKDVFEDDNDRIWVATSRGLNLYHSESNSFQVFNLEDGLLDNSINAILEDSNNNIWLTHNFGITRIKKELDEIQGYLINSNIRKDGLNIRAASIDHEDNLFIGSSNGLFSFNPNDLQSCIKYQPNLELTDVKINNLSLSSEELASKGNKFDLHHHDRIISFDFAALEYNSPEQIQYSYRMVSFNDTWHDVSGSRNIELNQLNPGKYILEIKATNNDCRWSEKVLRIEINMYPVWWNIGWVRLLFLISGILIALSFHYYRSNIIRKRNLHLESLVKNRTSELTLLNKKLESASQTDFLTGLYNRMGFTFKFNDISVSKGCIVLGDIDNFKNINDIYGHSAGDELLTGITKIMLSLIQQQDFVARWGGEEFIFYIDNKNASQAFEVIEQIRLAIQNAQIKYLNEMIPVTCTFGICQIQSGMELNDCINAADKAMYDGKSKGRNTTVISRTDQ